MKNSHGLASALTVEGTGYKKKYGSDTKYKTSSKLSMCMDFFFKALRNEEKNGIGQKLGHSQGCHVVASGGITRKMMTPATRCCTPAHVGAPVIDEAAGDDQLGKCAARDHGKGKQTGGRLEPAWQPRQTCGLRSAELHGATTAADHEGRDP